MIAGWLASYEAEHRIHASMSRDLLITALESALAACRMADRELANLRGGLAAAEERIADRDRALEQWATAFAPNRPLGVRYP